MSSVVVDDESSGPAAGVGPEGWDVLQTLHKGRPISLEKVIDLRMYFENTTLSTSALSCTSVLCFSLRSLSLLGLGLLGFGLLGLGLLGLLDLVEVLS